MGVRVVEAMAAQIIVGKAATHLRGVEILLTIARHSRHHSAGEPERVQRNIVLQHPVRPR
jgi:hypothetical protein